MIPKGWNTDCDALNMRTNSYYMCCFTGTLHPMREMWELLKRVCMYLYWRYGVSVWPAWHGFHKSLYRFYCSSGKWSRLFSNPYDKWPNSFKLFKDIHLCLAWILSGVTWLDTGVNTYQWPCQIIGQLHHSGGPPNIGTFHSGC